MTLSPFTFHLSPFKIGIIGPESTGKTTLAKALAQQFHGTYVPEYAREYIERKGTRDVSFDELCAIARHQMDEIASLSGTDSAGLSAQRSVSPKDGLSVRRTVLFFDTELIVTKVWFDYAFGRVPEWLDEAIKRYPMDVYLLTAPDIPWQADPARYHGSQAMRQELFDRYEAEIQALDIPYYIITHTS